LSRSLSRLARLLPRGRTVRLGPLSIARHADGLLLAPAQTRAAYGESYVEEKLPAGLTPEELRQYVGRMGWYHEIDLGNGVLTRGMKSRHDIRREWELAALGDLTGKSLLDIGGVDGAYAFLAERAGASPVAVLDHYVWAADSDHYGRIYQEHVAAGTIPPAPHESEAWHPDSLPSRWRIDTARQALHSRVEPIALDFAECELAALGQWDIVLYLGVLYHMRDPLRALRRLAAVTREQAIIETEAMFIRNHPDALWRFFPAGELNHDRSSWWTPNINALMGIIGAAGLQRCGDSRRGAHRRSAPGRRSAPLSCHRPGDQVGVDLRDWGGADRYAPPSTVASAAMRLRAKRYRGHA
jgi:tRNA (mo5U34)-methyltransferase